MKKLLTFLLVLFQVFTLVSCTSKLEKSAFEFVKQFNISNLTSEFSSENAIYGIFLSDCSETVYQYKIEGSNYYINLIEERSFSQYGSGIEDDLYNEAKSIKNMFYVNANNLQLYEYNYDLSTYTYISELSDDDIESIIMVINQYLDKAGTIISFSGLYPIIDEVLRIGENYGSISFFGDYNIRFMTFTLSKDVFLQNAFIFKNHLRMIYGEEKYNDVIGSISDSSYDDIYLKFEWDSENEILMPYFLISFKNVEYYKITVIAEDFIQYVDFN